MEFLRIKSQAVVPEPPHPQHQQPSNGCGALDSVPSSVELPLGEHKESLNTNSKANGDTETDALLLLRLGAELEEERSNSQRICDELAKEKENCQHMISLLEEEKREMKKEMKQREAQTELQLRDLQEQMSQAQSQSFEIQRYKEEKELLNTELQETTRKLVREQETAERLKEEVANSALRLCNLEEERERREEETRRLEEEHREELDRIRQLLEEGEKEIDKLEKEDSGIKASKNRQNQERVSFGQDEDEEGGPDREQLSEVGLTGSVATDILMERYLSTAQSNSCLANQSFEEHILGENSANYRSVNNCDDHDCGDHGLIVVHVKCIAHLKTCLNYCFLISQSASLVMLIIRNILFFLLYLKVLSSTVRFWVTRRTSSPSPTLSGMTTTTSSTSLTHNAQ